MEELIREPEAYTGEIETIRVETALSRFPIHALSGEAVKINLQNLGTATQWKVSYNSEYGQPGWLAYKLDTLVINRKIEEVGRPVPKFLKLGTLTGIGEELGSKSKNLSELKKALHQNASTYITAKLSYKTKEGALRDIEFGDTRYGVVFTGEKLPDGRKADGVFEARPVCKCLESISKPSSFSPLFF